MPLLHYLKINLNTKFIRKLTPVRFIRREISLSRDFLANFDVRMAPYLTVDNSRFYPFELERHCQIRGDTVIFGF